MVWYARPAVDASGAGPRLASTVGFMSVYTKSINYLLVGLILPVVTTLLVWSLAVAQSATTGVVLRSANLRAGPGTTFPVVGAARPGQRVTIVESNAAGDWYRLATDQWIAAFLINVTNSTLAATATRNAPITQPAAASTPLAVATSGTANRSANLRAGPGTTYAVVGTVRSGQSLNLIGRTADGAWVQIEGGAWIAAFLVNGTTATPPAAPSPLAPNPTVAPVATPRPAGSGNDYVLVQKRLWDPYENGGSLDGPSVHCGYRRELVVNVLDANGNRVNGVAVQVQYGAKETVVTGAQGRGDGVATFVLGGGQDVKVIRDASGRAVTSDVATGLSTNPQNIGAEFLRSANYCQDEESCRRFAETNSCNGHFSWTVTFQQAGG